MEDLYSDQSGALADLSEEEQCQLVCIKCPFVRNAIHIVCITITLSSFKLFQC